MNIFESIQDNLKEGSKYTIYVTSDNGGSYSTKVYDVVDSEEQASDIVAELQAHGLGASYEEGELNEDAWDDNFTISVLQKDKVFWKRKSDGKEIVTSLEVFNEPTDPTEWKSEEELSQYEIEE